MSVADNSDRGDRSINSSNIGSPQKTKKQKQRKSSNDFTLLELSKLSKQEAPDGIAEEDGEETPITNNQLPVFKRNNSRNQDGKSTQVIECNSSRINLTQDDNKVLEKSKNPATEVLTPSGKKQLSLFATNTNSTTNPKEQNILQTAYAINYSQYDQSNDQSQHTGRVAIPDFSVKKTPLKYSIPKKEDMILQQEDSPKVQAEEYNISPYSRSRAEKRYSNGSGSIYSSGPVKMNDNAYDPAQN